MRGTPHGLRPTEERSLRSVEKSTERKIARASASIPRGLKGSNLRFLQAGKSKTRNELWRKVLGFEESVVLFAAALGEIAIA